VMQLSDDSSSSNASSIPNEESARFAATQSHYAICFTARVCLKAVVLVLPP
jgi:hypothetical protein